MSQRAPRERERRERGQPGQDVEVQGGSRRLKDRLARHRDRVDLKGRKNTTKDGVEGLSGAEENPVSS